MKSLLFYLKNKKIRSCIWSLICLLIMFRYALKDAPTNNDLASLILFATFFIVEEVKYSRL